MPQFNIPKFEPPKEDADTRVIWTTKKVEQTTEAIENGYEVPTPFHENNPAYKKGNIVFEYTELEMDEIKRCARDIVYFANNHCQVMTDDGYMRIKLRDYQEDMLLSFQANRFNICLAPRQIGKTICSAIFLTWFLLFNFDKNVMLLANKGTTTREILDKIRAVVEGLPFFMKPGIIKKDVMSMKFDNECRIMGQNTTKNAGIGFTIHLLFLDEFAHVDSWIAEEFYGNIYPTLSSSQISKIVITSPLLAFEIAFNACESILFPLTLTVDCPGTLIKKLVVVNDKSKSKSGKSAPTVDFSKFAFGILT